MPGMTDKPLPDYANELTAFHEAFEDDLRAVVHSLPISPTMKVLDVGCGDGFYMGLLAERLVSPGRVIGLDVDKAFLNLARANLGEQKLQCDVDFVQGELAKPPAELDEVDLVWCAQSLYSLPEPVPALRQMAELLKPGGTVAVLENDTLHQILLPWPGPLEIGIRAAEYQALKQESKSPQKYYIGRRLPSVFAEAGLETLGFRTQGIDRRAPIDENLQEFLKCYLMQLAERVRPLLERKLLPEFEALVDSDGERWMLRDPNFTMSWINVLVWGRKPLS